MIKNTSLASIFALTSLLAACGGNTPEPQEPEAALATEQAETAGDASEANAERAENAADAAEDSAAASDTSADKAEEAAKDAKE